MYHHSYEVEPDETEEIRYLSWAQKRRIVAAGLFLMTVLGYILALNSG
jgi:hypothetical protein